MKQYLLYIILMLPLVISAQVNSPDNFKVVDIMPRFPGCEDQQLSEAEKKQCADEKMLGFIFEHIKYPKNAQKNGIEGTCVVQFVVEKDGSLTDIKVVRDIGGGCGEESARVVELMKTKDIKWRPGYQRGRVVRVQFNLPIKFRLENDNMGGKSNPFKTAWVNFLNLFKAKN